MSVFDDMARDAGYRGDEARRVARSLEETERQRTEEREAEEHFLDDPNEHPDDDYALRW